MPNAYARELEAALAAATQAGREIMALYESFEAIADAPAEISTEADRRSQDVILKYLHECFPGDAFCAEENTASLAALKREGPRLWIIDPIDGTRGFAKKLGEFSVMVGLVEEGTVRVGVVTEPARGRCTYAVRGQGCWRRDGDGPAQRCQVSRLNEWTQATIVRSRSEKKNDDKQPIAPLCRHLFTYSAGIKLAMVARAEAEVYVSTYTGFNAWDVCAGHILVEEAGGKVTDGFGKTVSYRQDGSGKIAGTVATNGLVQKVAVETLRSFLAWPGVAEQRSGERG